MFEIEAFIDTFLKSEQGWENNILFPKSNSNFS